MLPEAMYFPLGDHATVFMLRYSLFFSVLRIVFPVASQTCTVPSSRAAAISMPLGDQAISFTRPGATVMIGNVSPVAISQTAIAAVEVPIAICLLSGDQAMVYG